MSIEALKDYTFVSKYARYDKEKKRRETWEEAIDRVKQMHLKKYPMAKEEIEWAFKLVLDKRVLGSQRALQFGGKPIEKINERIYNCSFSYCDRLRFFQESLFLLLCGSGVGFSVQKHHVAKLPNFNKKRLTGEKNNDAVFKIHDSIQGWADALGVLLSSYFENPVFFEYANCNVQFDYSSIRPKGSPLSSGAGKAPGPEPLRRSLEKIRELLDKCLRDGQTRLRPIDAYDIVMHSSDAVLSGGVRRSACLVMFSLDDEEMLNAKIGNWFYENPQRGRSNNSVTLLKDKITYEEFSKIMKSTKEFGEPGFIFVDDLESGFNPCVEANFYSYDSYGNSGYQFCNLDEINGGMIKNKEDFKMACKAAAIIGTLQAGYTTFNYLGEVSENITKKEALLGCSITGIMENPDILLNPEIQREMAEYIKEVNKEFAAKIGVNASARTTCVKPSGTTSCLLGTSSGIHPHHAKRYFRRVQANELESSCKLFESINPLAVETSVWGASGTDKVITFCIDVPDHAKTKNDLSAIDLLELVKSTQQNWVSYGKNSEKCVKPWLNHNVSNTINVKENEWEEVTRFLYENRKYFAGVSLLPSSGDKDYQQAPMCQVFTPKEIVEMYGEGSLLASGLIVDGLHAFSGNLWTACDAAMGLGEYDLIMADEEEFLKKDWIRRARQFAKRYFNNDVRKMTYCLKDVSNWKIWLDLNREYKPVDYTKMVEESDNTNFMMEAACAGGACLV